MNKRSIPLKTIVRQLSSVEPSIRERALRKLLNRTQPIPESDFPALALGLYYFFWYCDKTTKEIQFLKDLKLLLTKLVFCNSADLKVLKASKEEGEGLDKISSKQEQKSGSGTFKGKNGKSKRGSNKQKQESSEDSEAVDNSERTLQISRLSSFCTAFLDATGRKFARIDVHRVNKFLMLFRHFFFIIFGLDFSEIVFSQDRESPPSKLEFFECFWGDSVKSNLKAVSGSIRSQLMGSYDREGLLLEFIRSVGKILPRLQQYSLFSDVSRLFLFCKPLFDLLAFTGDKRLREILKDDFLKSVLLVLKRQNLKQRKRFGQFVMAYAKSPGLKVLNRTILYEYIDQIEAIYNSKGTSGQYLVTPENGKFLRYVFIKSD